MSGSTIYMIIPTDDVTEEMWGECAETEDSARHIEYGSQDCVILKYDSSHGHPSVFITIPKYSIDDILDLFEEDEE